MANLRKDILSEEERASGFELGEHDDDTFSLGTTDYTEDLEKIFSIEDESADESGLKEPDDYVVLTNTFAIETPITSEEQPAIEAEPPANTEPKEEVLVMDDDFKDIVKDLLNKDKSKREVLAKIAGVEDGAIDVEDTFNPEEHLKDADSLFLDEIAKQEEYVPEPEPIKEQLQAEKATASSPGTITDKTETVITESIPKSEEKKKKFPLWLAGSIAASVLIISATIIYFVVLTPPKKVDIMATDTIKTELFTKSENRSEKQEQGIISQVDTVVQVDTVMEAETEKIVAEPEYPVTRQAPPPATESKPEQKPIAEAKPKQTVQPRATAPPKSRTTAPAQAIKVAEPDELAKIAVEKKDEPLAAVIPEKKPETKEVFERDIIKQEFAVQIYSSPSREDAERWLEKLRAKNINDAYITEQKIRDLMWYRVRFGKYETREEARAAALRYGYAQTWIDRVR